VETSFEALADLVKHDPKVVVLTGAGISIKSGIPPYRDHAGKWLGSEPIQHQEFLDNPAKRQRYWARSAVGWPAVAKAKPNAAHQILARLEQSGLVTILVTQNVDRLHQKAGHRQVVDLHGRLDRVTCLGCRAGFERSAVQTELLELNPFLRNIQAELAPDGDAAVADRLVANVKIPTCPVCGGVIMPDVVFFGGAVPVDDVQLVTLAIESCDIFMVIGSSLMVYSGYRFCRQAAALGKPIVGLNQGKTRADDLFTVKIEKDCIDTLSMLETLLL